MLWIRMGAFLMASGILMGAFGAHALKETLEPARLETFKTGVFYQLVNALGLLILGTLQLQGSPRSHFFPSGAFLSAGILFFSGSLYLIAVNGMTGLGLLTPVGGLCLAAGWILLIFSI